ncbi:MAG: hypothetical protein H0W45_02745 [Acidobacteria bacterium]|nr:hypothetical protein [Acidobacteriota bacterium]
MNGESSEIKIALTLYRGLNGTNPSAFRVDEDGVSVFENSLPDYKYNLPIRAVYQSEKVAGVIAQVIEPMLKSGIAEYTPQFGAGHWSLRFPDLEVQDIKNLLSKFAKVVLK